MATKRSWSDFTPAERTRMVVAASVQLALATAAWVDLAKRPAALVNGPKPLWGVLIAVNFIGPLAYFVFGRRRDAP
ncbi:MAG TPA: PLD nuclease N-terminal domain-containing protein [Agromyces mariniharenae]|nr:PLD nuclease N-terminal domain-containing protein [Agromyces mariniharenae]